MNNVKQPKIYLFTKYTKIVKNFNKNRIAAINQSNISLLL